MGSTDNRRAVRAVRAFCWTVTICAGFLQAWAVRFSPSPDATNYLDMAGAVLRGDWKNAVNAYWSPLFSWLLALGLKLTGSKPYWESTLLQLVNFAGLLVALWSFEFFFRALLRLRERFASTDSEEPLSEQGWWVLGYGLFLSTAFFVQAVTTTTPDVWVSAFTYLAAGLILRIRADRGGWRLFALLGLVLGCAYLTKAFYFPMSFVFLLVAWLAAENIRKAAKQVALALVVFSAVTGPWVVALSRAENRVTFGDAGALNYVKLVDRPPNPVAWQGENDTGTPKHPVRQLLRAPRLYEFATPVGGTYPPTFGWSYWMEGARPRFDLRGQLSTLRQSAGTFFLVLWAQIEYCVALLMLFFLAVGQSRWTLAIRRQWYLWVLSAVAFVVYSLVLVEGRYVAPFVLLVWVAGFSTFFSVASDLSRRAAAAVVLSVVLVTGLRIAKSAETNLLAILSEQKDTDWDVSQALRGLGIQPGDTISTLAVGNGWQWARLTGVRVVSEIPFGEEGVFWSADPETQRAVFETFAGTGAKVVVTKDPPSVAIKEGWVPLGSTNYYAFRLAVRSSTNP
jgi:4-amino-4-deoxy-L-arabinose transferase-like glycosyltransferase